MPSERYPTIVKDPRSVTAGEKLNMLSGVKEAKPGIEVATTWTVYSTSLKGGSP